VEGVKRKGHNSTEKQNVQFPRHPEGKRRHGIKRNVSALQTTFV
jgi:hypothetical protein